MKIKIYNKQKNIPISSQSVQKIVSAVLQLEKQVCDEVFIHFVTAKYISELHKQYFNDPSLTDCISFPLDNPHEIGYCVLGEVFVCPYTAIQYAQKNRKDPYEECTLYIIHGILHLLGYDDQNPQEKAKMRRREKRHLLNLKKLNLFLKK